MPKEIFIHEWKIQDYAGRREPTMKSEGTINGEHVYACKNLTSWFRLGKYLIKHDHTNYLLGLLAMKNRQAASQLSGGFKTINLSELM